MPQTALDMVPKAKLSSKKLLVLVLKVDEFNDNTLSNTVARCFHIFVIVLLVEYDEKKQVTAFDRASLLNLSPFSLNLF